MNGSRTIFSERPAVAAARGDLIEQRQKAYDEPIDVAGARKFGERLEVGVVGIHNGIRLG